MEYINTAIGLFMIALGFLVKKYPDLIAGYNTMSDERKKKVDIEGLSNWMKNGFIGIGVLIILSNLILMLLGFPDLANYSMMLLVLLGTVAIAIVAQRYDHHQTGD